MEYPVTESTQARNGGAAHGQGEPTSEYWQVPILALAFGFVAIVAIHWDPVVAAVSIWTNSATYRASYFVLPIALYFVWLRRADVAPLTPRPFAPGLGLVLLFALIGLVSSAADVRLGQQLAVVGILQALILTTLGWRIFNALLFPILFLWLLVPAGDFLIPSLLRLVTWLTVTGVNMTGLEATSDGNLIAVATGKYSVVEECSALDFLIGAGMISLVFGALMYHGIIKRAVLVGTALLVAILANGFRTTTVILITHHSGREINLAEDHIAYGWTVFFLATVALMWLGYRFADPLDDDREDSEHPPHDERATSARVVATAAAAVIITGAVPAYTALSMPTEMRSTSITPCLPTIGGQWQRQAEPSDWRPVVPGAAARSHHVYSNGDKTVDLYIGYFVRQQQGAELVASANRVADGKPWYEIARGQEAIQIRHL